jgi:hypothetical protein
MHGVGSAVELGVWQSRGMHGHEEAHPGTENGVGMGSQVSGKVGADTQI